MKHSSALLVLLAASALIGCETAKVKITPSSARQFGAIVGDAIDWVARLKAPASTVDLRTEQVIDPPPGGEPIIVTREEGQP